MQGFWEKVDKTEGCWNWTACLSDRGYGLFRRTEYGTRAHRIAWSLLRGPIPEGAVIDHLCRNRRCVNPDHLEPVGVRVNTLRSPLAITAINAAKTHCIRGHEFTSENTYLPPRGAGRYRDCRKCKELHALNARTRRAG